MDTCFACSQAKQSRSRDIDDNSVGMEGQTRIDGNHVNNLGCTSLLEIVILCQGDARHQEATLLVLQAGVDPNLADKDGVTPLAHARTRGRRKLHASSSRLAARFSVNPSPQSALGSVVRPISVIQTSRG